MGQVQPETDEFRLEVFKSQVKGVSWRTASIHRSEGETVFRNDQLPRTIYLEGNGCGIGEASFSIAGSGGCETNTPLQIFGANATLAGVAEADEEFPGGFIASIPVIILFTFSMKLFVKGLTEGAVKG